MSSPSHEEIFAKVCELLKPYNPQNRPILKESGIMSDLEVDLNPYGDGFRYQNGGRTCKCC